MIITAHDPDADRCLVLIDGVLERYCLEVDEEAGTALVALRDAEGRPMLAPHSPYGYATELRRGKITLVRG